MLKRIESVLIGILILCVLSLAAHNVSLNIKKTELTGNISDGDVFYTQSHYYKQPHEIKLSVNALGEYYLMINGQPTDSVLSPEGYDTLVVYEGDTVAIDLRNCNGEVSVFVADTSEGVTSPEIGTKMFLSDGLKTLFVVNCEDEM